MKKRVAAVVVFKEGVTVDEARRILKEVVHVDNDQTTPPQSFDPRLGWPVFYIP